MGLLRGRRGWAEEANMRNRWRYALGAMLGVVLGYACAAQAAAPVRFDFTGDGLVDTADALLFGACMSGPGVAHDGGIIALAADIDGDGDVDQADFGVFQRCFQGDQPADPNCANFHAPQCTLTLPLETLEDTPRVLQLTATDADLPWDELTISVLIVPNQGARFYQVAEDGTPRTDLPPIRNGEVVANPEGKVWFVPPTNWWSSPELADIAFRYRVTDAAGASSQRDLYVNVLPVNDPPELESETFVFVNSLPSGTFRLHPTDVEVAVHQQSYTVCFTALPQHGTLYADGVTPIEQTPACFPTLNYTYVRNNYTAPDCGPDRPASDYPLTDSFSGYVSDGLADSAAVTDNLVVQYYNSPPVLTGPAAVEALEDTPAPLEITATDLDNDDVAVIIADPLPTRGTLYYFDPDEWLMLPVAPGQYFIGVPVALTYVPLPDANTADGVADIVHVRLRDVRLSNPFPPRNCDYQIPIHIAPLNDPPLVTCSFTPYLIANANAEGLVSPAITHLLQVADDALPGDLLTVTMTAGGPEADHIVLVDPTGLVGFQQVSPTRIEFQGTVAAINAAFSHGVQWHPNGSHTELGTLTVEVNDAGHAGSEDPPVPRTATFLLDVLVEYEGSIPL